LAELGRLRRARRTPLKRVCSPSLTNVAMNNRAVISLFSLQELLCSRKIAPNRRSGSPTKDVLKPLVESGLLMCEPSAGYHGGYHVLRNPRYFRPLPSDGGVRRLRHGKECNDV